MAQEREGRQLDFMCPKCVRALIASAHDGHLFCPDCGFQAPKPLEETPSEPETFGNGR